MTNSTDEIKAILRQLDWKKLKKTLDLLPATQQTFYDITQMMWHTDSMVRRRPGDDGKKRDHLITAYGQYYEERGVLGAVGRIHEMRAELLNIDYGYVEIHSLVSKMASAKFSGKQRIAGALAALDYAMRKTLLDAENKHKRDKGVIGPDRNLTDAGGDNYDPDSNTHGLTVAGGDVIMLEAYREGWFDTTGHVVLPNLDTPSDELRDVAVANLANANMWRLWKNIDERVRFLNAKLEQFTHVLPEWASQLKKLGTDVEVAFEFTPEIAAEQFDVMANERLDRFLEQSFQQLIRRTNVRKKIALPGKPVALIPLGLVSIAEAHAAASLGQLTKVDISNTKAGGLLLSERLRGYAVLQLLTVELEQEQKTYFPSITRARLISELVRCGLTHDVAVIFIEKATFGRASRDLYDQPLVKKIDGALFLFGSSLLLASLPKIMISSLANEGSVLEDKGELFEQATIKILRQHGLNARKLKVKRGIKNEHEFDYDVAFTWDNFVFFLECKNRGIPMGNPIATHYFNQEMQSHVKQVQRLRQGLFDFPDILKKDFPEAVGKIPVFCLVNALPFSLGKFDDIYIIDDSILGRFFKGPTINSTFGHVDGTGPQRKSELRRIWSASKPTALDFIEYLTKPPQLDLAAKNYEVRGKLEQLSLSAFAKVCDFRRQDMNAEAINRVLHEGQAPSST